MAIGLGKIFGFDFSENFNYPYISTSITEFWRRWHISLSNWFKNYLYIPLGGNKTSIIKWIRNILIVWFLTGLWHGANYNFILWGLFFAFLLILEKTLLKKILSRIPKILKWIVTIIIINISWIIFRIESVNDILLIIKNLFAFKVNSSAFNILDNYDIMIALPFMIVAFIGSFPIIKKTILKIANKNSFYKAIAYIFTLLILLICISYLVTNTYNPFIYFRF